MDFYPSSDVEYLRLDGDDGRSQPREGTSPYREASSLGKGHERDGDRDDPDREGRTAGGTSEPGDVVGGGDGQW